MTPQYRAKKIDSDEFVEGGYAELREHYRSNKKYNYSVIFTGDYEVGDCGEHLDEHFEIDLTTLEISFDNGENWNTIERVSNMIRSYEIMVTEK